MKRKIALLLALIIATLALSACGKFTCDLCGQEKSGSKHETSFLGTTITVCDDCYQDIRSLLG